MLGAGGLMVATSVSFAAGVVPMLTRDCPMVRVMLAGVWGLHVSVVTLKGWYPGIGNVGVPKSARRHSVLFSAGHGSP